jgi:hypothetical protein
MHRDILAAAGTAAAIALAAPAASQTPPAGETQAFAAAMAETLDGAGEAAPLVRCAGLFRAFRVVAGEDSEAGATAAEYETDLAVTASVVWQQATGAAEARAAFDAIVPMVAGAAELFLDRMAANRADGGSVFDDALDTELAYCDALRDGIVSG